MSVLDFGEYDPILNELLSTPPKIGSKLFWETGTIMYPPTKGGLEACVFNFLFTCLDAALVTKTMCTQNLVPMLLYGDSSPSGDVWVRSLFGGTNKVFSPNLHGVLLLQEVRFFVMSLLSAWVT